MKQLLSKKQTVWAAMLCGFIYVALTANCLEAEAAKAIQMNSGQTKKLTVSAKFKNTKWKSSNKKIVTVNKKGNITAKSPGTATITAKSGDNSRRYQIKVLKVRLNKSRLTLKVGSTRKLVAKNALGKIRWSSNSDAVKVNLKGKITAIKKGKAVITAKIFGKKYKCNISVENSAQEQETADNEIYNIKITVGKKNFAAVLYKNATTQELLKRFPMTISMSELNSNEKYYYLPYNLPVNSENVSTIKNGDLMLYGSDCLVLFYKNFSTSYQYTRMGHINDPDGLAETLGKGTVTVTFQN